MKIQAKEIKIVPIGEIKPTPNNRNIHSKEQIERLHLAIVTAEEYEMITGERH